MKRTSGGLAALLLLAVVACGGSDEISESALSRMVLQPRDLPPVWVRFDTGPQTAREGLVVRDPERYGRRGGWKARYRRPGTTDTRGALVIDSRADLFADADGAKDDFALTERAIGKVEGLPGSRVAVPEIGDSTTAATSKESGSGKGVRFYLIAWRYRNVTASLIVSGFEGRIGLETAVALARKQQARIEEAA